MFGQALATEYHNVLVINVQDSSTFVERLSKRVKAEPGHPQL
jgi:hypothetical protein